MHKNRGTAAHMNLGRGGLALEGHDPVAYFEQGRAVKGSPEINVRHRGATYYFSTLDSRARFESDPERFLPAYGGWCATAMAAGRKVAVDPTDYKVSGGRLFLFFKNAMGDTAEVWNKDEAAMMRRADGHWKRTLADAPGLTRARKAASWGLQLVAAVILFQTLFFKFTGAEESIDIFTRLGMEPWGRIGSGVAELIACILLLVPRTAALGALMSLGVISGAIASHLGPLGIVVKDDGGLLFVLAVVVWLCSAAVAWLRRAELPIVGPRLGGGRGARTGGAAGPGGKAGVADQTSCRLDGAAGAGPSHRVLILGGGFGGVYTALELEKRLDFGKGVEVTLVNRENFFLFTPMLHEVAASDLDVTNIVSPVRKMLRKVSFFEGDVEAIDLERKRVTLCHGSDRHTHQVEYDYLVVSLGSVTNFFNLPGLAERALTIKSLGDAIFLRNRLISSLEEADTECAASIREPLMTFVVAGGGFAGVETIASLNDFVREALPYYPHLSEADLRVVLVHSGAVILPELGEELGRYAQEKLLARGVEVRTGTRVTSVDDEGATLADGTFIRTRTLVWTAGTSPHPLLRTLPCEKDKGRLLANEYLELPGYPGVWALGDCTLVPDRKTGKFHPPTAQHALREGRTTARNIVAAIDGGSKTLFAFSTLGQLATIGRRAGVAKVFGMKFSGFPAWWLWRTIYLSKLPRAEKKIRVALDWTLDLFFSKDLVQFLTHRAPTLSGMEAADSRSAGSSTSPVRRGAELPGAVPAAR